MKCQEYIDLGFERIDLNDSVEFKNTGYSGFCLEKVLSSNVSISVCSGDLDKPKLYIKKAFGDNYHILQMNGEIVKDLLLSQKAHNEPPNPFAYGC